MVAPLAQVASEGLLANPASCCTHIRQNKGGALLQEPEPGPRRHPIVGAFMFAVGLLSFVISVAFVALSGAIGGAIAGIFITAFFISIRTARRLRSRKISLSELANNSDFVLLLRSFTLDARGMFLPFFRRNPFSDEEVIASAL